MWTHRIQIHGVFLFQERIQQRNLKVHEKTTYTSRVNAKTAAMRKIADESEDELIEEEKKEEKDGVIAVKGDPQFTLAITRGSDNTVCTNAIITTVESPFAITSLNRPLF